MGHEKVIKSVCVRRAAHNDVLMGCGAVLTTYFTQVIWLSKTSNNYSRGTVEQYIVLLPLVDTAHDNLAYRLTGINHVTMTSFD